MAAKKKPVSTALAPAKTTAVALPGSWRERAKQSMVTTKQALAKLPQAAGNFLSFRGGVTTYNSQTLKSPVPVVVLTSGYERSYYDKPFNPDSPATPACYSFDGETPHEKAKVPQSERCATCHWNQFGTSSNGNGKGCNEGAKLVMLHADHIKTPQGAMNAPLIQARLSFLNSRAFKTYAENVFNDNPMWTALSMLTNQPDQKSQYAVSWAPAPLDVDEEVLDAIAARVDEAEKLVLTPYTEIEQTAPVKQAGPARRRKF